MDEYEYYDVYPHDSASNIAHAIQVAEDTITFRSFVQLNT